MKKLDSFKYKGMIFHNVKDNLFQTDKFGDKLIYEYKNERYYLIKDERLSKFITSSEIFNKGYNWYHDDNFWK